MSVNHKTGSQNTQTCQKMLNEVITSCLLSLYEVPPLPPPLFFVHTLHISLFIMTICWWRYMDWYTSNRQHLLSYQNPDYHTYILTLFFLLIISTSSGFQPENCYFGPSDPTLSLAWDPLTQIQVPWYCNGIDSSSKEGSFDPLDS